MENSGKLKNRTVLITGASRGIGLAIAKKLAADGANIVIAARTVESRPGLKGLHAAAKEIEEAGGTCLPFKLDVQNDDDIKSVIETTVERFGGIDIVINNCTSLNMTPMFKTDITNFDNIYHTVNRATFVISKLCHPHLKQSDHAHILNISPPLNMNPVWFKLHMAYTAAKYSVSMYTLGMAQEFQEDGIAANSLWPKAAIYSSGAEQFLGPKGKPYCRNVEIMADAAYAILIKNPKSFTGNLLFDEEVLMSEGINNFEQYRADTASTAKLFPDIFTDEVSDFSIPD